MRDGEKGHFPEPYPASKKIASVPADKGYSQDDGFCDFAFGSAQNDKVGGKLQRLKIFGLNNQSKGRGSLVLCLKGID